MKQNELNIKGAIYFDLAYWRPVDAEGFYLVSTDGRVWSVERRKYLKPQKYGEYLYVKLLVNGVRKNLSIHRLVALAFLENPENLSDVNHKDENPENNNVENLEWVTHQYNINWGSHTERVTRANSKPLIFDGVQYESISACSAATGHTREAITRWLNGVNKLPKRLRGIELRYV